jgi:hypothetical protein
MVSGRLLRARRVDARRRTARQGKRILITGADDLTGRNSAIDGGHHPAAPSAFAEMSALTPEDWAEANRVVRARAEQEKALRCSR